MKIDSKLNKAAIMKSLLQFLVDFSVRNWLKSKFKLKKGKLVISTVWQPCQSGPNYKLRNTRIHKQLTIIWLSETDKYDNQVHWYVSIGKNSMLIMIIVQNILRQLHFVFYLKASFHAERQIRLARKPIQCSTELSKIIRLIY